MGLLWFPAVWHLVVGCCFTPYTTRHRVLGIGGLVPWFLSYVSYLMPLGITGVSTLLGQGFSGITEDHGISGWF